MPRISAYHAPRRYTRNLAFWTTDDQWAEVVELADRRDISIAKLLRNIVTEYLKVNSVRTEEFLDKLALEQQAKVAELEESGDISLADAQDHFVDVENRKLNPNCDFCTRMVNQFPAHYFAQ